MLPAFKALEDNEAGADEWRGTGGPLHIGAGKRDVHPLIHRALAACAEVGLPLSYVLVAVAMTLVLPLAVTLPRALRAAG